MRSFLTILISLLLISASVSAFDWNEHGKWKVYLRPVVKNDRPIDCYYCEDVWEYMIQKFSKIPGEILITDHSEELLYNCALVFIPCESTFSYLELPEDSINIKELQLKLYWKFYKNDSTFYLNVNETRNSEENFLYKLENKKNLTYKFTTDIAQLPIPTDSTTWNFNLEIWDSEPPDGIPIYATEIDTNEWYPSVLKYSFDSEKDSLVYCLYEYGKSKERMEKLYLYFENEDRIVRHLFNYAYDENDKNDLLMYGKKLIEIYYNDPEYCRKASKRYTFSEIGKTLWDKYVPLNNPDEMANIMYILDKVFYENED